MSRYRWNGLKNDHGLGFMLAHHLRRSPNIGSIVCAAEKAQQTEVDQKVVWMLGNIHTDIGS